MHIRILLFKMLYERGSGELWYYDENGNFVESHFSRCGVRLGFVLGPLLFCMAMYPVYVMLHALPSHDGALYAYSRDVYLTSDPVSMANTLASAPGIYGKAGLTIGWGPGKTKLILPPTMTMVLSSLNWRRPVVVAAYRIL